MEEPAEEAAAEVPVAHEAEEDSAPAADEVIASADDVTTADLAADMHPIAEQPAAEAEAATTEAPAEVQGPPSPPPPDQRFVLLQNDCANE